MGMWVASRYAAHSSDDRELVAAVAEGFDLIVGEVLPFGEEAPQPGTYSGAAIPDLALDPRLGGGPLDIGVEQREKIIEPVGTVGVEVVPAQLSIGDALVLRRGHADCDRTPIPPRWFDLRRPGRWVDRRSARHRADHPRSWRSCVPDVPRGRTERGAGTGEGREAATAALYRSRAATSASPLAAPARLRIGSAGVVETASSAARAEAERPGSLLVLHKARRGRADRRSGWCLRPISSRPGGETKVPPQRQIVSSPSRIRRRTSTIAPAHRQPPAASLRWIRRIRPGGVPRPPRNSGARRSSRQNSGKYARRRSSPHTLSPPAASLGCHHSHATLLPGRASGQRHW